MNRPPPLQLLAPRDQARLSEAARARANRLRDEAIDTLWADAAGLLSRAASALRALRTTHRSQRCPS